MERVPCASSTTSRTSTAEPTPVPLEEWRTRWLPGLAKDQLLVGLNWSGGQATGLDLEPNAVEGNLAAREGKDA